MLTNPFNDWVQPTQTIGALNRLTVALGHGYSSCSVWRLKIVGDTGEADGLVGDAIAELLGVLAA